ncbi:MAG: serine/threonine-protein kinase [Roseburia sp.]|nr:serine/threonine-protein kinase [Roseburia sp.]
MKDRMCYSCMQQIKDERADVCPACGAALRQSEPNPRYLREGTVLQGKFIIGKPLGAGGFGNTYIGWNQVLLCRVAIKEYYPGEISGRDADGVTVTVSEQTMKTRFQSGLKQFLEEARNVANLQHIKGVVSIYNFFEENGTGYIVMEYLEGMDVKTILKKRGDRPDYEWNRRIILTVLHTLREIHKQGVLHRDIAPDNIFVTNEGVIKLIDFGAAKHESDFGKIQSEIVLKVGYAPIEQYSRTARQGPYTDLYAVAALFYRLLTGVKPPPANERKKEDTLKPPSELGVSIPEQAEMAIMVCLNIEPKYRLQSAGEFMEALDGLAFVPVYEPEWILPPEPKERGRLSTGKKALIVLLLICLLGGGIGAGVVLFGQRNQAVHGIQDATERFAMPDCSVMDREEAVQYFQEKNIPVAIHEEYSENVGQGGFISQSVEKGTLLSEGEPEQIILTYSLGRDPGKDSGG